MAVDDVVRAVERALDMERQFGHWLAGHKTARRYAVIDPLLWALGWNTGHPHECLPDCRVGNRGQADYVLLDQQRRIAAVMLVTTSGSRRRSARARLWRLVRGMTCGVGILVCGPVWEMYDLSIRSMNLVGKFADELCLGADVPDAPETVANALCYWVSKEQTTLGVSQ